MTRIRLLALSLLLISSSALPNWIKKRQKSVEECEMKTMKFIDVMGLYFKSDQFKNHREYIMERIGTATKEELDQQNAKTGRTVLHMATANSDYEIAKLILKRGAYPNPDAHRLWRSTPLRMLADPEKYDVYTRERFAYLLLKHDADGSIRQDRTILCNYLLFTFPDKELEESLTNQKQLASPKEENEKEPEFISYLWHCWGGEKAKGGYWKSQFEERRPEIMERIRTATKEELDQQDARRGWSTLHMAAARADEEMVELLLKQGANPSPQTYTTRATPLHILCDLRRYSRATRNKIGKLLLNYGADPTIEVNPPPGCRDAIPEWMIREMRAS